MDDATRKAKIVCPEAAGPQQSIETIQMQEAIVQKGSCSGTNAKYSKANDKQDVRLTDVQVKTYVGDLLSYSLSCMKAQYTISPGWLPLHWALHPCSIIFIHTCKSI